MKTLFFIFILCFLASFLTATIINVSAGQSIQDGITAAANGDTVLVQPGTYYENINYNGKLITVGSLFLTTQNTAYIFSTIIDGNSIGSVVTFEYGEDSSAILCGFTVTNGSADFGGGIYCNYSSSPSLENLIITGNSANSFGGGIYCGNNSNPYLSNVDITGNSSSGYGGGLECEISSSPYLNNVAITGNSANYYGGGLDCYGNSNPSLNNVTISDNSAGTNGGGIYCYTSYPTLINSILWNNSPQEIYTSGGSVTATYSDIEGGFTGTGNIDSDPLFVDAGNGDYHLSWANFPIPDATMSPCIDAGDPALPLEPDNTIADMGAYYFYQYLFADFTSDITNGEVPLTVNFTDISTQGAGVIDEWYWEFGDGNNSSLQNPANEYLFPGIYTVSLTVTDVNDSTDTETKVDYIIVNALAYYGPVWHISTTGSDVWGNGSEQYPFVTIQHGIDFSANTDTVLVQPGTYVENINFSGKLITAGSLFLTTQDTSYISTTIIDGNNNDSVVIFTNGENSTAILCGFTITNGLGSGPYLDYFGGGITCKNLSNPCLENVKIIGNTAISQGGGIYCNDSSPSLYNVIISDNFANQGGGICCWSNSNPSLDNVTISGNILSGSNTMGGGIYCYQSNPSLVSVAISNNSALMYGGGIWLSDSSPSLLNVEITGNSAGNQGGGIYCWSNSNASFQNVTISGNSATTGGGIYCNSDPILINCILWNDSPEEIYIGSGSVTATYSDIEGGWAGTGNINSNPLFVDPGNGDYHLQTTSPCIDAGDPVSPLDPDGTIADMGAYYFHHSGPVWHVSTTGSDITGNGSEQFPFASIQLGINYSADTDTVLVQPGTYVENINYNGKFITVGSQFLTTQDTTYISSTTIDGNSSGSVVTFINSEDSTAVLCGFTIQNGISTGNGGGIYCVGSSPSLENLTITGNSASSYGGGIYCYEYSSPSLQNVTITGNTAYHGGGINCYYYSSPSLQNVTITGNTASGTFGYGGGIYCWNNSSPSLENVTISGNSAANSGGGIRCYNYSSPILQNVTISGNSAADYGGGIYCSTSSSPSFENVTISGNSAGTSGGGIFCGNNSSPSIINSILWNDSPEEIYIESGSVTATYSDIEGGWTGTGNIDSDPLFVDPGNNNYYLLYTSPCIDTGNPSSPLDPDGTIADMGAYCFDQSNGVPTITAITDVPNDQGRFVIVTWQRSIWDQAFSVVPIVNYNLWEKYPFELDRESISTNDINQAIQDQGTYFQREDTTWVNIANVSAMQWEEYSALAETFFDSTTVGDYLSYFFVSAHTPNPWLYFSSSVASGYSVDNIAPDETRVYIAQNGSNIGLTWDEVEYGTFQGNSYPEINGIWYKIYAGDFCDFICDEAHLIDTVTDLNYNYPLAGEEKKFFKIVVSDQPEAGRSINRFNKPEKPAGDYRKAIKMFLK